MIKSNSKRKEYNGVTVQYQCEFMENYVAESAINEGKGIQSLKFGEDKAVIFFIGKNGVLTAIINASGSDAGWDMVSLSEAGYEVNSFDFYYDEVHQKFRICFSQRKNQLSELLVSEEIVLNQTHIEQFKSYLKYESKRLSQPSRIVDHITMDQRGVLFSTSFEKTDALYHYFEYHRQPENYTLPENTIQAKQLSVGRLYGDYGVFVLYEIGKNGTMLFQSFPEKEGAEISQYRFETGEVISCFDLLEDEAGNSILYVAGKGIFKFDSPDDEKEEVAPKTISYSKIDVSKNDDDVTIWALDKKDRHLYYITNTFQQIDARGNYLNTIQRWTLPLKMHEGITEFTAIKGDNFANQLFLFDTGSEQSKLIHFWQDEVSKHWQEHPIQVSDLNATVKINTYSIDLHLSNGNPKPVEGQIHISGKENMVIYINNKKYFLVSDKSIGLDFSDYINIVCPLDSIAAAPIVIAADFLDTDLVIDPTQGLQEKIKEKITSGKDLSNAKKQNGDLLIAGNYKAKELDEIAKTINTLATTAGQLGHESTNSKSGNQITANGTVALAVSGSVSGNLWTETGNTLGDLFYSIKKGFTEVTAFVINKVKEGVQFVIEIAGKVVNWIVDTAKGAFAFLERIWEKVKVFFKDLVEFLAFLFDWQDILDTKDALSMTVNKCLDGVVPQIDGLKNLVVENIRELKRKVDKAVGFDELKDDRLNTSLSDLAKANQQMGAENTVDNRPNWVNSKKEVMFGSGSVNTNGVNTEALKDFSGQTKDPHLKKIVDLIAKLFKGELPLGEFIKRMGQVLVEIAFELIEELVKALFDLLIDCIGIIKEFLNAEIRIPILSEIYKKVNSGHALTILDFSCLLVAIPMTIAYKLINGTAPFSQLSKEEFSNRLSSSII